MKNLAIYDNGGKTLDRYTIIDMEPLAKVGRVTFEGLQTFNSYHYVGASETGAGFYQHGEIEANHIGRHLGKKVKFDELAPELQRRLRSDFDHLELVYSGKEQMKAVVNCIRNGFETVRVYSVIAKGRHDKSPDCKISSFADNLYFRTRKGLNSQSYSSIAAMRSAVDKAIKANTSNVISVKYYLTDKDISTI